MLPQRARHSILLAALLLAAGCLAGPSGDATPSRTPTATTTETAATTATTTGTATPPSHRAATNRPDADAEMRLENRWTRRVEMRVRVVRDATNETVHEGTYTLSPGAERTVYNVSEADPRGIESFTIVVAARNATDRIGIETSACYGDAFAEIRDDGTLYVYYSIC